MAHTNRDGMKPSDEQVKQLVREFLRRHELTVIATVTPDGLPEAAVIEFGETDQLELIFDTITTYRKYANLQANRHVAFVIGWDEAITIQYEGLAHELAGEELITYQEVYLAKNPKVEKWRHRPDVRFFKVEPTWIRYSDLSKDPWEIHELNLTS